MPTMLEELLAKTRANDPIARNEAYERLGDYLAYQDWEPKAVAPVLEHLVEVAATSADDALSEIALNDLRLALNRDWLVEVSFDPIAAVIDRLKPAHVELALVLLGRSQDAKYIPLVRRFVDHEKDFVRRAARGALEEIGIRPK